MSRVGLFERIRRDHEYGGVKRSTESRPHGGHRTQTSGRRPTRSSRRSSRRLKAKATDGYRMVTAWASRKLGRAINRKRVLQVMRERKLIGRRQTEPRRRRPGFFRLERRGQLWHLDMTSPKLRLSGIGFPLVFRAFRWFWGVWLVATCSGERAR